MISLPTAVNTPPFRWQAGLWWFAQRHVHGAAAGANSLLLVADKNFASDPDDADRSWYAGIPHVEFRGVWADPVVEGRTRPVDVPLNIPRGLRAALPSIPADRAVEVTDCDMFRHAAPPDGGPGPGEVWVCDLYEEWHLKSKTSHRHVVERYLRGGGRYNGGFVPIVGTAGTIAGLLDDWEEIHRDILRRDLAAELHWWAGMFALQAACDRAGVAMVARDTCHIPPINPLRDGHYISHYSVDPRMPKRCLPQVDVGGFLEDRHYGMIRAYCDRPHARPLRAARRGESPPGPRPRAGSPSGRGLHEG